MRMKKVLISLNLIVSVLLFGCKSDDQNAEIKKMPSSISSVYNTVNFYYTANGQLVKVTEKESDEDYSEIIFTYNSTGKVTKFVTIQHEYGDIETYSYNINYPSENEAVVVDDDYEYTRVSFDEKGQAISFNNQDEVTNFNYDDRGNIVKITDSRTTTTASYNNDKGILSGINAPKWILLLTDTELFYYIANNPVSINSVYQYEGQTSTYSQTYNYLVEHVIKGYPTKMTVDYNSATSTYNELYTITY